MRVEPQSKLYIVTFALSFCCTHASMGQPATPPKPIDHGNHGATKSTIEAEPALDGYCPAAYLLEGKALHGLRKFSSVYIGETYYLSSEKAKLAFDKNPEKYLPKLGGWCLMALGGPYGNHIIGNSEVFEIIDGSLYLFSSQRAKNFYESTPGGVVEKANRLFSQAKLFSHCPVSFVTKNQAVKGDPKLMVSYKRAAYCFASAKERSMFIKQPTRYVPPYEGYCATTLVNKKLSYANPKLFNVYKGKVYFFLDADAKQRFDKDPAAIIKRADPIWKKIQEKKIVRKGEDPNG